jgi:hypothetical protein
LSEQGSSNSHAARLPHQGQGHLEAEEKGKKPRDDELQANAYFIGILTLEYITKNKHHQK